MELEKDVENSQYVYVLGNTGKPFPEDIDIQVPKSFGLKLLSGLVSQIDGTMEIEKKSMTVFTIRFPMSE